MSATFARVTLADGRLADDSFVTIFENGVRGPRADVPKWVEPGGRLAPARICAAIASLGYRPVDYYDQRKCVDDVDIDVEAVA